MVGGCIVLLEHVFPIGKYGARNGVHLVYNNMYSYHICQEKPIVKFFTICIISLVHRNFFPDLIHNSFSKTKFINTV